MRNFLVLFCLLFFVGCSDSGSKKKIKTEAMVEQASKRLLKQKPVVKQPSFLPTLSNKNYEDILLKYGTENKETDLLIETEMGNIKIRLYKQPKMHRASFIYLAKMGYFNTTVFYRVIDDFVVQGGNSDNWDTQNLKAKIGNFKMKPEFFTELYHKRGAVAMARNYSDNPDKLSSPYTFYIVQRGKIKPEGIKYLRQMEDQIIPGDQADFYMKFGGSPSLDAEHTVIGEVLEGMDVVDAIAKVDTDEGDWPKKDIKITVKVLN